jgi:hypothetical protein
MFDAARGLRVRNATYRTAVVQSAAEELSEQVASRDLRLLTQAGLFEARGETRGRFYVATAELRKTWHDIRRSRPARENELELFAADSFQPQLQLK